MIGINLAVYLACHPIYYTGPGGSKHGFGTGFFGIVIVLNIGRGDMEKLKRRADLPEEKKWDLTDIYPSDQAFHQDLDQVQEDVEAFVHQYKRKIWQADQVIEALDQAEKIYQKLDRLSHYAFLPAEADQLDEELASRAMQTEATLSKLLSDLAFLDVQIAYLPLENLDQVKEKRPEYAHYISRLEKVKPHLLSEDVEAVLADFDPILHSFSRTYNDIKQGDIRFAPFEVKGKKIHMTYNAFENRYEGHPDYELRHKAFQVFYDELDRHKEGTASVYNSEVLRDKIESKLRGYDSVFDFLLEDQEVPRELYDRQIDVIMEDLAPIMRKYAKLIQEVYGLDKMTTADLLIPLDPEYKVQTLSFQEAGEYIKQALSPLGEDYQAYLDQAFSGRWIDYGEYQGKATGAFATAPYLVHPYFLTSFTGQMDEVITLAHELGHGGHMILTNKNQNYFNAQDSMYFSEAPSTTNELIMENYLLGQTDDPREKRWIISFMISSTYYHNFVTHLLEAAYQREVYKTVDKGGTVSASLLTELYGQVLKDFWGDEVEVLDGSRLTWMRQPHYYSGLYSYSYSAGLTIGTQVARKIVDQGRPAAEEWLEVLRQGGSKSPMDLAAMVGVDLRTDQPLKETIAYIGDLVDQAYSLTDQVKQNL